MAWVAFLLSVILLVAPIFAFNDSNGEHAFQQILDHFNPQYFNRSNGPVILDVCGEDEGKLYCSGSFIEHLAKILGAAVVSVEHRYYGRTLPFASNSRTPENLKYLSTDQALNDLASFREYYQENINNKYNKHAGNPWLVVGASYAGSLSAWFRLKYPHLVHGAVASSAPIDIIEGFEARDEQVAASSCKSVYKRIMSTIEERLNANASSVKAAFRVPLDMDNDDFLDYLTYGMTIPFISGIEDNVCRGLEAKAIYDDVQSIYAQYMAQTGVKWKNHYKQTLMSNNHNLVSWKYQQCTELGLFLVAAKKDNIRPSRLNVDYYRNQCQYLYGIGGPNVNETNTKYGGLNIAGTHIFFVNGSEDFWSKASKLHSSPSQPSVVLNCKGCGHTVGFGMDDCDKPGVRDKKACSKQLTRLHGKIVKHAMKWLRQRINH